MRDDVTWKNLRCKVAIPFSSPLPLPNLQTFLQPVPFQLLEYQIWWWERLIWYSRVFGLYPPCTRATPLGGRYPSWWVGEVRKPFILVQKQKSVKIDDFQQVFSTVSLRSKPPCQEGSLQSLDPSQWVGLLRKASAPHPPIPVTRVSDMMVGAVNQKQTPSSLPPHSTFLTEVTSMTLPPNGNFFISVFMPDTISLQCFTNSIHW